MTSSSSWRSRACTETTSMCYGAEKVCAQLNREGTRVARSTVRTTRGEDTTGRPVDLVDRDFNVLAPNRLWSLTSPTYGPGLGSSTQPLSPTPTVGWNASRSLKTDLALAALEQAICSRLHESANLDGLVHHSDRGVQHLSIRYTEHLAENALVGSVGSRGDSYDNALAESIIGLYKTEPLRTAAPGQASTASSSPRWNGSTGTTTDASSATSASSHAPNTKPPTTLNTPQPQRLKLKPNNLHKTRAIHWRSSGEPGSKRARIKRSTHVGYECWLRREVFPRLGDRPLAALRPSDFDGLVADLEAEGRPPGTIRSMLSDAVRLGVLASNPALTLTCPPRRARVARRSQPNT